MTSAPTSTSMLSMGDSSWPLTTVPLVELRSVMHSLLSSLVLMAGSGQEGGWLSGKNEVAG
jgi:hypothetical protein